MVNKHIFINWITMTRKSSKHCMRHTEQLDGCFLLSFGSAFCGLWFDLQWGRSWYTLLMRPKVETTVQFLRMSHAVLARFSGNGNLNYNIIPLIRKMKKMYIHLLHQLYFAFEEQNVWQDTLQEPSSVFCLFVTYKIYFRVIHNCYSSYLSQ